jgi:hypothetical protein
MLTAETVLQIIRLSLELALEAMKGMNDEQRQAFWARHEKRVEFWEGLLAKLSPGAAQS